MTIDQPPIFDHDAHAERVALDQQIAARIDQAKGMNAQRDPGGHGRALLEIRALQKKRAAAFRREVGMA